MTPEEGEMSTCTTACNVAVDARADSRPSRALAGADLQP